MRGCSKMIGAVLVLALLGGVTGCDETGVYGILSGMSHSYVSAVSGVNYPDGSYGNWLTGTYIDRDSSGNSAIWGDGFYCVDGECSGI